MESFKCAFDQRDSVSLYIHIPFCFKKCIYCDFTSFSGVENLMEEYSKALSKDILSCTGKKVKTIFIGGGTPTYLSLSSWENIYKAISSLKFTDNVESQ
jgi:oxygen-independent coproporphyrinogen III oxidase